MKQGRIPLKGFSVVLEGDKVVVLKDEKKIESFSKRDLIFFAHLTTLQGRDVRCAVPRVCYVIGDSGEIYPLWGLSHPDKTGQITGDLYVGEVKQIASLHKSLDYKIARYRIGLACESGEPSSIGAYDFEVPVKVAPIKPTLRTIFNKYRSMTGEGCLVPGYLTGLGLSGIKRDLRLAPSTEVVFASKGFFVAEYWGRTYTILYPKSAKVNDINGGRVTIYEVYPHIETFEIEPGGRLFKKDGHLKQISVARDFARKLIRSIVAVKELK